MQLLILPLLLYVSPTAHYLNDVNPGRLVWVQRGLSGFTLETGDKLDPYEVLGLTPGCKLEDVRRAFRERVKELGISPEFVESDKVIRRQWMALNDAQQVLSDPELRAALDRRRITKGLVSSIGVVAGAVAEVLVREGIPVAGKIVDTAFEATTWALKLFRQGMRKGQAAVKKRQRRRQRLLMAARAAASARAGARVLVPEPTGVLRDAFKAELSKAGQLV